MEVIITVTEETGIHVRVKYEEIEDECSELVIEPYDRPELNPVWVRQSLLHFVPSIEERIALSKVLTELIEHVFGNPEIIQCIRDKDGTVTYRETSRVLDVTEQKTYDDISTSVEHILYNFKKFFSTCHYGIKPDVSNSNNLINKVDHVVFIGHEMDGEYVKRFKEENKIENEISDTIPDDEDVTFVLALRATHVKEGINIVSKYADRISLLVCDTMAPFVDLRESAALLAECRRKAVLHVRQAYRKDVYNFGVTKPDNNKRSFLGVIHMGVGDEYTPYNSIIRVDPRMAQLLRHVSIMNGNGQIHNIVVKHEVNDFELRDNEHYKINPEFQMSQFACLGQSIQSHKFTTPLAFQTPFPGIAKVLIQDHSVFASCRTETVKEYMAKIDHVFTMQFEVLDELKARADTRAPAPAPIEEQLENLKI